MDSPLTNRTIAVSLCLALSACGGSPTGVSNNCTVTLSGPSGAQGGKFTCAISAAWQSSNDQAGISITYGTVGQTDPVIDASVGFTGEPRVRTYSLTDSDARGGVTVVVPFSPKPGATSYAEWAALNGQGFPRSEQRLDGADQFRRKDLCCPRHPRIDHAGAGWIRDRHSDASRDLLTAHVFNS